MLKLLLSSVLVVSFAAAAAPADTDAADAKLCAGFPKHTLADDAAYKLARLRADRRNDPSGARAVLEAALAKGAGDKKAELSRLLASLPKPAAKPTPVAPPPKP